MLDTTAWIGVSDADYIQGGAEAAMRVNAGIASGACQRVELRFTGTLGYNWVLPNQASALAIVGVGGEVEVDLRIRGDTAFGIAAAVEHTLARPVNAFRFGLRYRFDGAVVGVDVMLSQGTGDNGSTDEITGDRAAKGILFGVGSRSKYAALAAGVAGVLGFVGFAIAASGDTGD